MRTTDYKANLGFNIGAALRAILRDFPEGVRERTIEFAMIDTCQVDPDVYHGTIISFLNAGWIERVEDRLVLKV